MKTLNIHFEDSEIAMMEKKKKDLTWREFILETVKNYKGVENNGKNSKIKLGIK